MIDNGYLPDTNVALLIPVMTSNTKPSGVASATTLIPIYITGYTLQVRLWVLPMHMAAV